MRRLGLLVVALLACHVPTATGATFHFVDARLVTMTDDAVRHGELLVRDGRIVAVGTDLEPGEDTVRIDVEGGYLLPGLAEMHAHVPARDAAYRDEVLFLYVANGITTIRGMLGAPEHLALRDALAAGEVLGPRLVTSGPSFNGTSVSSPEQAAAMVRDQAAAGYDFLKIHPGLTRAEYDAMAAAARTAEMTFAGHVPVDVGLLHALESGQSTVDHLDGYVEALVPDLSDPSGALFVPELVPRADDARVPMVVRATKDAGAWVVPTETLLENLAAGTDGLAGVDARPQNRFLPPDLRARYRAALSNSAADPLAAAGLLTLRKRVLRELHAAGVGVLLGSDAPQIFNVPGFSAHRELESMVAAGLTPFEALKTGTVNPARFFGREAEFGTLAPGRSADIVWLRGDPLADIRNTQTIQGVMVRGRWLDRDTLDERLEALAASYASAASAAASPP